MLGEETCAVVLQGRRGFTQLSAYEFHPKSELGDFCDLTGEKAEI